MERRIEPRPLTARQAERRSRILASAIALVSRMGFDAVTMRMIAQDSGTAEKTLYNIFGTKDRLIAIAARERSAGVFDLAGARENKPGLQQLLAFVRAAAEVTLEQPVLSRALARLLLEHSELVGLHELYEVQVGAILKGMAADGQILRGAPTALLVRLIRLEVVSGVVFWSHGEISDTELEPYLVSRAVETLLPYATPDGRRELVRYVTEAGARMATGALRESVATTYE